MSEWLRRKIRNLLGFARTGSNPVADGLFLIIFFILSVFLNALECEFDIKFPLKALLHTQTITFYESSLVPSKEIAI